MFTAALVMYNPLTRVNSIETTYKRSNGMLLFEALWGYFPFWMVKLLQRIPAGKMKRFHSYREVARGVAREMIRVQTEQYNDGNEGGKDMLSILSTHLHVWNNPRILCPIILKSELTYRKIIP